MKKFDVFIIGTGTAGETAAGVFVDEGLHVGIADEREYGGTCALRGCQPKKYFVVPSHAAVEGWGLEARGFVSAPELDWSVMQKSKQEFTSAVPEGTRQGLIDNGVEVFDGHCRFESASVLLCGDQRITADHFLVTTGARPRPLTIPGGEYAHISDDFLNLQAMPRRIAFIGGGYISMEFATIAAAVGSEVTIVERGEQVMSRFDGDMVRILIQGCAARDMNIVTHAETESIEKNGDTYVIRIQDGRTVECDLVFAALGRMPNVEDIGLERAGVTYGPRGIETDTHMATSAPAIYAAGDCVASIQLSPVSDAEARTAARNIIARGQGVEGPELDISVLPTVVFSYPQLAQVGLSEGEAEKLNDVRVEKGSGAAWPNYRRLNEKHVGYKVMIDDETGKIVGAVVCAPHAGELINGFALVMRAGVSAAGLKELPWAYPTYMADIKYMVG